MRRTAAIDQPEQRVQIHTFGRQLQGGLLVESRPTKARLSPRDEIGWCEKVGCAALVAHDPSATAAGCFLPRVMHPTVQTSASAPRRENGYAPIRDYAVIGDGRTAALVARDGSIDWLCLPNLDSGSVFAALLDADRGGAFRLAPTEPFTVERRYLQNSNVLETTFTTALGRVRVTDAMPLPLSGLAPTRELVRSIEGLSGEVPMRWRVEPRFDYGRSEARIGHRAGVPVASAGQDAIAVLSFEAGEPECGPEAIEGQLTARDGARGLLALSVAHGDPLVFSPRSAIEGRLTGTLDYWRSWAHHRSYAGRWQDAVLRSSLALKLLIHAPSGAIAAAVTTSLPEELGGVRNWDYRYSWIRDSSATLDALLSLGCPSEGDAFFWWLLHASQLTHPRVNVLYRLNGRAGVPESELDLDGYQGSRPVRIGNAAAPQRQLDVYGHLLQTAWLFVNAGGVLSGDTSSRLASTADLVGSTWREEDSGIWEVRGPAQALHRVKDDVLDRPRPRLPSGGKRPHPGQERLPLAGRGDGDSQICLRALLVCRAPELHALPRRSWDRREHSAPDPDRLRTGGRRAAGRHGPEHPRRARQRLASLSVPRRRWSAGR